MRKIKKILSLVMSLVMVVSLFAGIDITSVAESCIGHEDWNEDGVCDNCSVKLSVVKLTSDKNEIAPGETFSVTVSLENAKGLNEGELILGNSWESDYELIDYSFNDNLSFEERDDNYFSFSFNESVQSDTVEIVTATFKPLRKVGYLSVFFYVGVTDFELVGYSEYVDIEIVCPHKNTTEYPEKEPTCEEYGYSAGVKCNDCEEWISGHNFTSSNIGHVDENNDNICEVCDVYYKLSIGENIIRNTNSDYDFYLKIEKSGYYKIKVDEGISVSGFTLDENNEVAFCLDYSRYLYLNTENYVGDNFSVTIILLEETKAGHADDDFDEFCDNCSAEIYSTMNLYSVATEDETCEITGYELSFHENDGLPLMGDWYETCYTEIYKYHYDYDVQKSLRVTSIAEGAFVGLNSMKTITIPASVTSIGDYAIGYKEKSAEAKLEGFVIYGYPGTVAEEYAKENEFEFTSIIEYEIKNNEVIITSVADGFGLDYIPEEIDGYPVTTIGENCFADRGLFYLNLPENITTIKAGAFRNNPNLGEYGIEINNTLKTVEDGAFEGCGIVNIQYYGTPEQWAAISIGENNDALENAEVYFNGTGNENFNYRIIDGKVVIFWVKASADIVVPETLDGYPVSDLNISSQEDSDYFGTDYYYQITIPSSVTYISPCSVGYYYDWNSAELFLIPDFKIIGVPGSYAETYANENGITFEALPEVPDEPTTEEPTTEEPTTEEPTTKEPETQAPTTEKPSERPSTDGPAIDGPATDGPTEKPVSDKLEVSGDTVKVDNASKVSAVNTKSSANDILKSVKNEKVSIVDKDGKAVSGDALVGTGAKIQIKDNSGKVINTYTVCVPTDVDGNGKTTAADARLALRGSAKLEKVEGVYATASDMNADGKITAADARKILRISAGLE